MSSWRHLAARLLDVITARPLTTDEKALIGGWLRPGENAAFYQQPAADQRHSLTAANFVAGAAPERGDLIRAALLHDLGKRHAGLGWWGRSVATFWHRVGGPPTRRHALYLNHPVLGAEELARLGAEPLVVATALHHHGERPPEIPPTEWDLLLAADRPRRPWERRVTDPGGR